MNVYDTLRDAGRHWSERTALMNAAGSLTYRELWAEIEAVRAQLDGLGVRAGQGIGIRARNGRGFVIGALAALGCGAVVMPIHHQMKPEELAEMLQRAPLGAILDEGIGKSASGTPASTLKLSGNSILRFSKCDGLERPFAPGFDDAAFVRFTSGTTGAAKGVVLTHRAVLERIAAANSGLKLGCEDRVLWVLPMAYHFYVSILLYLQYGSTVIVGADYLADSLLDTAAQHSATFLYITPMHVRMLTGEGSGRRLPPQLKRVMSVSSRLAPQAARDFLARYGVPVAQGYGIIEVGLPIMNIDEAAEHPEAIGRPVQGFEVRVVDDVSQSVRVGETGHVALRGPGMFAGYLSPHKRREDVLRDGWFLTGDLGHVDGSGRIVLDGRASTVIHIAGHKVFPEEVAGVLDQHPAVLRSRVTSRPHPELGEAIHAEIQLRNGASSGVSEEILAFCRRRLSNHKVPASIDFVASLNLTASGKVRHG